jgi:hypothetical protein
VTISANYPTPVQVNGYTCKNCTDVDYAKKHIDPAHPKSGPYGIDAKDDPSVTSKPATAASVTFGGGLAGLNATAGRLAANPAGSGLGENLDLSA